MTRRESSCVRSCNNDIAPGCHLCGTVSANNVCDKTRTSGTAAGRSQLLRSLRTLYASRYFPLLKYETQSPWFLNGPGAVMNCCQPPFLHASALSYVTTCPLMLVLSNCPVYGVVNPSTTS